MKTSPLLLKSLLVAVSLGAAAPLIAQKPAPTARPKAEPTPEPEPVLPGTVVARGEGWMSLSIENGTFRLGFYDAKKKAVPAPLTRGNARWDNPLKTGELRLPLKLSSDGQTLVGLRPVRGPYVFKVYVTLLDADEKAVETHALQLKP